MVYEVTQGSNGEVTNNETDVLYKPKPDFNGTDIFSYIAKDEFDNMSNPATVTVTINPINDAPVVTLPGGQTTDEDTPLTFNNSSTISVSDVDAGNEVVWIDLTLNNGIFNLADTTGLIFNSGGDNQDHMGFTGKLPDINNALNGGTYIPNLNYNGPDFLTVISNDLGNTGAGGALTDTGFVEITINPVNDAPVVTLPGGQTTDEDTLLTFNNSSTISVSDVDADHEVNQVDLLVGNGKLTLSGTTGLTFNSGGNKQPTMSFTGELEKINIALNGMFYIPNLNYNGPDVLTVISNDLGNTGAGGALTDTGFVEITINPVNDPPELYEIPDQSTVAGAVDDLILTASDPDNRTGRSSPYRNFLMNPNQDVITLSVDNLPNFGNVTDYGDGTATIRFAPALTDVGEYPDIEVIATDNGSPPLSDTETFTLTVIPGIGDVNSDGIVDVSDLIKIINFILGLETPSDDQFSIADVNIDGAINVSDLILIINIILGIG